MLRSTKRLIASLEEEIAHLRSLNRKLTAAALTAADPTVGGSFLITPEENPVEAMIDKERQDLAEAPKFL